MKSFGKIVFFVFPLFLGIKSFGQCVPDQTISARQGIFPEQLPEADMNMAYNQVVQFKAPLDTNVFFAPLNTTVAVRIDSIRIIDVLGLPPGISYQCNNTNCMINGGEVGCLLISGTTSEGGGHPLRVVIRTSAKIIGTPPFPDIPQVSTDTNTRYNLHVNWPTGLAKTGAISSFSLFPNPASHTVSIRADLSSDRNITATIYDITGKAVLTRQLESASHQQTLDIATLPKGLYRILLVSDKGTRQQKLLVSGE
jgi:hypothetical protein